MQKIHLELIPDKCIGRNLHSHDIISKQKWIDISRNVRRKNICRCCGRWFKDSELHAHEVWFFDMERKIQILKDIICVCDKCHKTIHYHFLLSNKMLSNREAFICKANYMEINFCEEEDFEKELNKILSTYRVMNQIKDEWSMDISYAIDVGYLYYEDIHLENLEQSAPGSAVLLERYKPKSKLTFNNIPKESMIDKADRRWKNVANETCEICGKDDTYLYQFYDLRIRETGEMVLIGKKKICGLCRKTIYHGIHRLFMKHRKTTKHYMKVNDCSYEDCIQHSQEARRAAKIWRYKLHMYFKMPHVSKKEFYVRSRYLNRYGARYVKEMDKWCLSPAINLKYFIYYLE